MNGGFRQSMIWLHTWSGLIFGWLLFFVFLTGTAGYFEAEIDRWMQPERPLASAPPPAAESVTMALRRLEARAPGAMQWSIVPPGGRENPDLRVSWREPPTAAGARGRSTSEVLDPASGEPAVYRQTGGGRLLYRMHYQLHYMPFTWGYWIVGIATTLMLIAMLSGVVAHKHIFRDFFTFRPGREQRSWLDMHNALAVLALPFHVMITYTGLLFLGCLYFAPVYIAAFVAPTYGLGQERHHVFVDEAFDVMPRLTVASAGVAAPLTALAPLVHDAERRWGPGMIRQIDIRHPGDLQARILVAAGAEKPSREYGWLLFDGTDGVLLKEGGERSTVGRLADTLLGLHEGLFAGPGLRWLFFLAGAMGTAMIGAGLVRWTVKRREKIGETFGFRLVERLNVGTIIGLPVAIAAYFWANRLIPVDVAGRAAWEAHTMFIVWAALLLHAFMRPAPRAGREQLCIAAAAYALLPLVNALTTDRHLGVSLPAGDWALAGFDLTVLAFGLVFGAMVWKLASERNRGDGQLTSPIGRGREL